jgi:hypothetical protein
VANFTPIAAERLWFLFLVIKYNGCELPSIIPETLVVIYSVSQKHVHTLNVHNSHINRDRIAMFSHLRSQTFKMSITSSNALLTTTCNRLLHVLHCWKWNSGTCNFSFTPQVMQCTWFWGVNSIL